MEFLHCPFCDKFVVVTTSYPDDLQKTMCKKCFKVFYVGFPDGKLTTYKESEVIVNKMNNTIILKKTIKDEMMPKFENAIHDLNRKLTERKENEHAN